MNKVEEGNSDYTDSIIVLDYKDWVKALSLIPILILFVDLVWIISMTELGPGTTLITYEILSIGPFLIIASSFITLIFGIEYTISQSGIDRHYFKRRSFLIRWDEIDIIFVNGSGSLTIRSIGGKMMTVSEFFKESSAFAQTIQKKVPPEKWARAKKWIDDVASGKRPASAVRQ